VIVCSGKRAVQVRLVFLDRGGLSGRCFAAMPRPGPFEYIIVGAIALVLAYGAWLSITTPKPIGHPLLEEPVQAPVFPVPTAAQPATGKWRVSREHSSIDDSVSVFATLTSDSFDAWLHKGDGPTLILRCMDHETSAYVATSLGAQPENGGDYTAAVRLDGQKAFKVSMREATSNDALVFSGGAAMIKKMIGHKRMLFRWVPFDSPPAIATFDITGVGEAIKPLREACKW
jgi:type VI secretion system protein VasI